MTDLLATALQRLPADSTLQFVREADAVTICLARPGKQDVHYKISLSPEKLSTQNLALTIQEVLLFVDGLNIEEAVAASQRKLDACMQFSLQANSVVQEGLCGS